MTKTKPSVMYLDEVRARVNEIGHREVARKAGISHRTVGNFAAGRPIQTDTLSKIAVVLNTDIVIPHD